MTSTSPSFSPTDLERLAWPGAAAILTVSAWVVFLLTENNWLLQAIIFALLVFSIYSAGAYRQRLPLTLLASILLIHGSFYALYSWPVPNILIVAGLLTSMAVVWHSTLGSRLTAADAGFLLGITLLCWLATSYLPSNLVNSTTLAVLPLFILLPAVDRRQIDVGWLLGGFGLCSLAAAAIIQTTVLYSV